MTICIVTPAPARSRTGNGVTCRRWARILRDLGHRVVTRCADGGDDGRRYDLMVALHARRSHAAIARFHEAYPDRPLVVALTGTDLYGDIRADPDAQRSLELAWRLIVLQPMGVEQLPRRLRRKARVIYQSVDVPRWRSRGPRTSTTEKTRRARSRRCFDVCVIGHLRPVKDPFRAAMAARLLPDSSRIRVTHVGAALSKDMESRAREEDAHNPRYRWLGDVPRWGAYRILERASLAILTSRQEGGPNVISEAIAAGVPIVSSRIPGSMGLLGADYPGYFPVGDTQALASLLHRVETDAGFHRSLITWCRRLAPLVDPARERQSWINLLRELRI